MQCRIRRICLADTHCNAKNVQSCHPVWCIGAHRQVYIFIPSWWGCKLLHSGPLLSTADFSSLCKEVCVFVFCVPVVQLAEDPLRSVALVQRRVSVPLPRPLEHQPLQLAVCQMCTSQPPLPLPMVRPVTTRLRL